MAATVLAGTLAVPIENVPVVDPGGIWTAVGRPTLDEFAESLTVAPPEGAGLFKVTVP